MGDSNPIRRAMLGVLCGLAPASLALAQQSPSPQIEEIIVTAQKRAQSLQDVPVAVSAFSGQALQDHHVSDVTDLNQLAPSLQVKTDDNAANPKIFIRGVGLNDFNPNTASAVGLYTDGVYIGSPLAQMAQFFDIDRLEVLRGPQGTLYGRNTTGGAINVISRRPTQEPQGDISVEAGRFDSLNVEAAVGGPLAKDVLAGRLAVNVVQDDGYSKNRLTGHSGNDADRWAARGSLSFTPSANFDALVQLRYGKTDGGSIWAYNRALFPAPGADPAATGPDGFCSPAFYTSGQCTDVAGYGNTSSDLYRGDYHFEGKDEVETRGASATLTWDLGGLQLVSVSGYDHADRDDREDTDAGPNDVITATYRAKQSVFSEELRLQSANEAAKAFWVAGLYYSHDDLDTNSYLDVLRVFRPFFVTPDNPNGFAPEFSVGVFGYPYTQKTESWAGFGQLDYNFTAKLTGTVGARYSHDSKDFHYASTAEFDTITIFTLDDSKDFSSVSGKLGLQYRCSEDANVYGSYSRGYKSGGFFGGQTVAPEDLAPYDDEKVDAFEVGAKIQSPEKRVRSSFAAFYYDYQDLQVYTLILRGAITVQNFTNASNARIYGAEAEFGVTPINHLDLSLSGAWLDATYRDFVSAGDQDYSGNRLPNSPRSSLTAAIRYEIAMFGGSLALQTDATYRSKVFYDTRNVERLSDPERTFVNARIGWTTADEHLEFGIWGRNLFDETNISDIIPIEGLGFDLFSVGPPRTAGVYARYNY
jgi:iron complex outermembrane recepter protein